MPGHPIELLTEREGEVLDLIAYEQLTNREIGERLCIDEGTVAAHVHHILKKLHCRNRWQAGRMKRAFDQKQDEQRGDED